MRTQEKSAKKNNEQPDILTIREAAQMLGCHTSTLYRLCKTGEVPAFRLGQSWRFRRESLNGWMLRGGGGLLKVTAPSMWRVFQD